MSTFSSIGLTRLSACLFLLLFGACGGDSSSEGGETGEDTQELAPEDAETGEEDITNPGECADLEDGEACDDGDLCTSGDVCAAGVCTGGENTPCDAGPCEIAGCDPMTGCYIQPAEDGTTCASSCHESASCMGGECVAVAETAIQCPASTNPCVSEIACDPASGECTLEIAYPAGVSCDLDDNECTLDQCDGLGTCETTGDLKSCEEESSQSPCWTWSCNGKAGCVQTSFIEGLSCNDGSPCTYSDTCIVNEFFQELCEGTPLPLDDDNPCTDDACVDGVVTHEPIDGISCPVAGCETQGVCEAASCIPPDACGCEPIDGQWTDWVYGDCIATDAVTACGPGSVQGTRTCSNPAPACGGADCEGASNSTEACSIPCDPTVEGTLPFGGSNYADDYDELIEMLVPDGVYAIEAVLVGGGGGGGFPGHGGGGARIGGIVPVQPGDTLLLHVGDGGDAHGGGGGASVLSIATGAGPKVMLVAARGGGAGSDGCSGCNQTPGGASNGGGGGAHGVHHDAAATGQPYQCKGAATNNFLYQGMTICEPSAAEAGGGNSKYGIDCGGGGAATHTVGGAGNGCVNNSGYDACFGSGANGTFMSLPSLASGGPGFQGNQCGPGAVTLGGGLGTGGLNSGGNGSGGSGGAGYYGGGGGGGMTTYLGAGGGGGVSWAQQEVTVFLDVNAKGQSTLNSLFCQADVCEGPSEGELDQGRGGDAGDHTNWPQDFSAPSEGVDGAILIFVTQP